MLPVIEGEQPKGAWPRGGGVTTGLTAVLVANFGFASHDPPLSRYSWKSNTTLLIITGARFSGPSGYLLGWLV